MNTYNPNCYCCKGLTIITKMPIECDITFPSLQWNKMGELDINLKGTCLSYFLISKNRCFQKNTFHFKISVQKITISFKLDLHLEFEWITKSKILFCTGMNELYLYVDVKIKTYFVYNNIEAKWSKLDITWSAENFSTF